ncbi:hypothetical protein Trydic_g11977 [Trypoxylus dichotomus]
MGTILLQRRRVDVNLNRTCRLVRRCTRATLAGFSSPNSRRKAYEFNEKFKQAINSRHPFFDLQHGSRRLKSRHRFLTDPLEEPHADYPLSENRPGGISCSFGTWRVLNRIKTHQLNILW